jgi:hypothetical protein
MKIAFYKVNNSKDYERHTFDGICNQPEKIEEMLNELPDDEVRIYDIKVGYDTRMPSLDDFVEDYNNEILDGGWWTVIIND